MNAAETAETTADWARREKKKEKEQARADRLGETIQEHVDEDLGPVLSFGGDGNIEQLARRLMDGIGEGLVRTLDGQGPPQQAARRPQPPEQTSRARG